MERYKYPRTSHLPYSQGLSDDDTHLLSDDFLYNYDKVIVTIKMDGENTTVYPDGFCHARSLDSKHRDYHSWLMQNIQEWCYLIPEGHRVCGEYLYAKHSIAYNSLPSYFLAFSVWKDSTCLCWKDTLGIIGSLGINSVPVVYEGKYDSSLIKKIANEVVTDGQEGVVVRNAESFDIKDFSSNVAKFVRKNHVQTDIHWSFGKIECNTLMEVRK